MLARERMVMLPCFESVTEKLALLSILTNLLANFKFDQAPVAEECLFAQN